MRKSNYYLIFCLGLFTILGSCNSSNNDTQKSTEEDATLNEPVSNNEDTTIHIDTVDKYPTDLLSFAKMVAEKTQDHDFEDWPHFTSETILFSPYANIDTSTVQYLDAKNLGQIYESKQKYFWGIQDGTGDSLKLSFSDYMKRYVHDFNLTDTTVVSYTEVKEPSQKGNEMHNAQAIFPNAKFVEIHKPADDEMGMNWRTLVLILSEENEEIKLLGLVHNEWTI